METEKDAKTVETVIKEPQVKISQLDLINKLCALVGSEIVTIYTNTDARLRKTSKYDKTIRNPFPDARKESKVNGLFNIDYANCVNNQLGREEKTDDFEATSKRWGKAVNDSKILMEHTKKDGTHDLYFQFNPRNHYYTKYVDNNGNELDKEQVEQFISDKSRSKRQGTETEIIWRTYKVSSITAIKMEKVLYLIQK